MLKTKNKRSRKREARAIKERLCAREWLRRSKSLIGLNHSKYTLKRPEYKVKDHIQQSSLKANPETGQPDIYGHPVSVRHNPPYSLGKLSLTHSVPNNGVGKSMVFAKLKTNLIEERIRLRKLSDKNLRELLKTKKDPIYRNLICMVLSERTEYTAEEIESRVGIIDDFQKQREFLISDHLMGSDLHFQKQWEKQWDKHQDHAWYKQCSALRVIPKNKPIPFDEPDPLYQKEMERFRKNPEEIQNVWQGNWIDEDKESGLLDKALERQMLKGMSYNEAKRELERYGNAERLREHHKINLSGILKPKTSKTTTTKSGGRNEDIL